MNDLVPAELPEIERALPLFVGPGAVAELRAFGISHRGRLINVSGF
jgi:hypothetical protein